MLFHLKAAALGEGCIRVRYHGKYAYASLVLSGTTTHILSLGVSDTSLAAAAAALQTVITDNATLTIRDVVAAINAWNDTTAARAVLQGDFEAEILNAIESDVFGGTTSMYVAEAGTTTNLKNAWMNNLIIDNDVSGTTSLRVPHPSISKASCIIKSIKGHAGTSGTPTVTRTIYDSAGNILDSSGAIDAATDALLIAALPVYDEPIVFDGPVVVRDTCGTVGHNTATTMKVQYAFAQAKNY